MATQADHLASFEEWVESASQDSDLSAQEFVDLMEQVADHADAQAQACRDSMSL